MGPLYIETGLQGLKKGKGAVCGGNLAPESRKHTQCHWITGHETMLVANIYMLPVATIFRRAARPGASGTGFAFFRNPFRSRLPPDGTVGTCRLIAPGLRVPPLSDPPCGLRDRMKTGHQGRRAPLPPDQPRLGSSLMQDSTRSSTAATE